MLQYFLKAILWVLFLFIWALAGSALGLILLIIERV